MQKFYRKYFSERTKEEENENIETKLNEVNEKMNSKLEKAFSAIMKEELKEVQEWIKSRQDEIEDEIKLLDCAIQTIQINLSSTKCFSESEIEQNLVAIQDKKFKKREVWYDYNILMGDSRLIYEEENIIENDPYSQI